MIKNIINPVVLAFLFGQATSPSAAFADSGQAGSMMTSIAGILSNGLVAAGAALVVWGGVNVGLAIKDGSSGNQLHQGILCLIGGVVVGACGIYFKSINWNF